MGGCAVIPQGPLLETLLVHVDEGIHVVDSVGVTRLYNQQAAINDGLQPDEVIGKHVLEVFPSLSQHSSTLLKVLKSGRAILNQAQTFTNYKGLRITTINSTWPLYHDGKLVGAVEMSKDVTRVRELSEQVVDLQASLLRKRQGQNAAKGEARYSLDDLIGRHPSLQTVKDQAVLAAHGDSPVLVYGETGTGKELLVHGIHQASPRHAGPLVAQNCAALPEGLLEGILFGTVKGSFTGAEDRPGLFELADGGTLYLDEINSMDVSLQAKLLRVLQDGRIRRVGDTRERVVDVRVIASSNEDPEEAVRQRRIRQDLYYRLNVVYLELPELRDRREDIPVLAQFFLRKHSRPFGSGVRTLSEPLLDFFLAHSWPGNVRELEHAITAALHMAKGEALQVGDLPAHLKRAAAGLGSAVEQSTGPVLLPSGELRESLLDLERQVVESALRDCDWNISQASRTLGVPRQTLQYRVKVLGLNRPQAEG